MMWLLGLMIRLAGLQVRLQLLGLRGTRVLCRAVLLGHHYKLLVTAGTTAAWLRQRQSMACCQRCRPWDQQQLLGKCCL
jgi:hypothetical protein